jgi:ethanolamine utilization protein EutA
MNPRRIRCLCFCVVNKVDEQWITSVGIDLGTSTTKFIVSRLRLGRVSSTISLPRYQIVERHLLYASPIYSTPLINREEIDTEQVSRILQKEYEKAGLQMSDIKSGAVIITGETATKRNAQQIVHLLAERSGDFVVATAGADLEGVLAGKGSGAESRSKKIRGVIANIDIGGGTANIALFQRGKVIGTVTFHIGGRLISLDPRGEIHYVSPHLNRWLTEKGWKIEKGQLITYEELKEITVELAHTLLSYLKGGGKEEALAHLFVGQPLEKIPTIDEIMISGGVGQLMLEQAPSSLQEVAVHGDFGPLLAHSLKEVSLHYPFQVIPPEQTVRATVIGAGMQSTEISGSTVYINHSLLPIRNLPVLKLELDGSEMSAIDRIKQKIEGIMDTGARLFDPFSSPPFALALHGLTYCSYRSLQTLADELTFHYKKRFSESRLMVVITENDMAKALGQSLSIRCQGNPHVICIDQIRVEHGDYIDLGEPISDTMIPVVIKTLAF